MNPRCAIGAIVSDLHRLYLRAVLLGVIPEQLEMDRAAA